MTGLSAVIIAFNEERNIGRCLDSLTDVADEIVVVDSGSTDRTKALCDQPAVRFLTHPFDGYVEQKRWAAEQCRYDRLLSLDADESLSPALRAGILAAKNAWDHDGYLCNRLTNYCGSWIRHTDWYPDWHLRLWDRRKGAWAGVNPHDTVKMQPGSSCAKLRGDLYHYSYYTIGQHLKQIDHFTDIMAQEAFARGKRAGLPRMVFNPCWKFFKSYVVRRGFLDGRYGLVIGALSACATFVKYAKLYQLTEGNRRA
jgi:glycosyltransferase involved in cell wall biosynthesis